MRYLGSKVKLLDFIQQTITKYGIVGDSFCDLFAGTASVSDFFKGQYDIIANDFMYYSYVLSKAKLQNSGEPKFERFTREYYWGNPKIPFMLVRLKDINKISDRL